jgi:hypothetical protein
MYTSNQSVSLGGKAFEPQDDDDIDSQESSIFGGSDISKANENMDDDTEGAFIENMGAFDLGSTNPPPPTECQEDSGNDIELERTQPRQPDDVMELDRTQPGNLIHSPTKVTCTASLCSGFSTAISDIQRKEIEAMLQQWIYANGSNNIPAHLVDLAKRAQVAMSTLTTPGRRDKRDKGHPSTPTGAEGAQKGILKGFRFVLTGVWPYQGSGQGLALGKERVKLRIEKFVGIVTMSISGITNALVVGDCPGVKKILEAHNRSLKIININQRNDLILGDLTLEDLTSADYPNSVYAVLDAEKIQVQHHPQSSVQHEQAQEGTPGEISLGQVDEADKAGDGHSNG